jgi:flagellum-specific peptidoglycan hydrolase FlgJ
MRFLVLILILASISLRAQTPAEVYINKYDSLAVEVMNTYGIPASLVLGVALQESGAGTSKLCLTKHNHFGVKGRVKSSKSKSGYVTAYRSFDSDVAAYLHFGKMISSKKYYAGLRNSMDYMKWLKAMKAANYATSSSWIGHVDKMIKRYDLTRFDETVPFPYIPAPVVADSVVRME